eukprot:5959840-Pyramimonas_sp.AAC.1
MRVVLAVRQAAARAEGNSGDRIGSEYHVCMLEIGEAERLRRSRKNTVQDVDFCFEQGFQ